MKNFLNQHELSVFSVLVLSPVAQLIILAVAFQFSPWNVSMQFLRNAGLFFILFISPFSNNETMSPKLLFHKEKNIFHLWDTTAQTHFWTMLETLPNFSPHEQKWTGSVLIFLFFCPNRLKAYLKDYLDTKPSMSWISGTKILMHIWWLNIIM